MTRRLVARLESLGRVLLAGPAVRAVAASGDEVVLLVSSSGAEAAALLPGVSEVIEFDAPWVSFDSPAFDRPAVEDLVSTIERSEIDEAVILTSYHQSPLPLALLMRLAGVGSIAATSVDYAGELLDVRHPYLEGLHDVEQQLSLCAAAGHRLPQDDRGGLRVHRGPDDGAPAGHIVVHPGASVPARGLPPKVVTQIVAELTGRGRRVVITGSSSERPLVDRILAGVPTDAVTDMAGLTDLASLIEIVAGAEVVVCGNTGIAHVAAAVDTPVVEAFAPTMAPYRWRPWMVPHVLLGRLEIECAGCRSWTCPLPGQPCLEPFTATAVLDAIDRLGPVGVGAVGRASGER